MIVDPSATDSVVLGLEGGCLSENEQLLMEMGCVKVTEGNKMSTNIHQW